MASQGNETSGLPRITQPGDRVTKIFLGDSQLFQFGLYRIGLMQSAEPRVSMAFQPLPHRTMRCSKGRIGFMLSLLPCAFMLVGAVIGLLHSQNV